MMTPGDFASLQEGREGLSTEDYIAWRLPEEEDPDDYPFPLTLKSKANEKDGLVNGDGAAQEIASESPPASGGHA